MVGLTGATAVTAGDLHSCAVKQNGATDCWGDNLGGELGDGTTTARLTPTPVVGLTGVTDLTAGTVYSCAVQKNSTAYCWGTNSDGQLGDGSIIGRVTPTPVIRL